MKTVREWAKHLPEPIRTQFLENVQALNDNPEKILDKDVESLSSAIFCAFGWIRSPQGHDYWNMIDNRAMTGEFNQSTPMTVPELLAKIDKQIAELKAKQAELEAQPMSLENIEPLHNSIYDAIRLEILKKQIEKLCNS